MCMCLARSGVGDEGGGKWIRRLSLGFSNPVRTGKCWMGDCVWVALVWVV